MSEERKVYDFVGVGIKASDREESRIITKKHDPIAIATPIRFSQDNATFFAMHDNMTDTIKDNLRNLIATNHGERLMLPDFGANLLPLAFELGNEDADTAAIGRITRAVNKYMPYVTLKTFEPIREAGPKGAVAKVGVKIFFSVPQLSITDQSVEAVVLAVS